MGLEVIEEDQHKSLQRSTHLPGTRRLYCRISGPPARGQCTHTAHFETTPSSAQSAVFTSSESQSLLRRLEIF